MARGSSVAKIPVPAGEAEASHHERQSPQQICANTPRSRLPPDHATAPNLVPIKITGFNTRASNAARAQHLVELSSRQDPGDEPAHLGPLSPRRPARMAQRLD